MSIPATVATPQTGEPGNNAGGGAGSAPATQPPSGERTFTQAELDNIIKERLAKQKDTMEGQARAEREKAEREAAEAKAKQQGEYQKLAESEKARADKAEREKADAESRLRERLIRSEITAAATALGFANPAVAHRLIDTAAVAYNEDGDPVNVTELLTKLAADEPYLIAGARQGGNAAIPRTPNASALTADQIKEQERLRLVRSGKYSAL